MPAAAAPVPARKVRRLAGGLADSAVMARTSPACADFRWSWLLLSASGRRLACTLVALPAVACQRAPARCHRHAGRAALVSAKWRAYVAGCGWAVRSRRGPVASPLWLASRLVRWPKVRYSVGVVPGSADSPMRGGAAQLLGHRAERDVLDRFLAAVRAGESQTLVVRGEPGVGKTALLSTWPGRRRAAGWRRAAGVESEMELAFAGVASVVRADAGSPRRLPAPQRDALRTAFGMQAGPVPDRFLVGLAVLSLLSEVAADRPLVCLVDDEQWLDRASAQVLAFVARRLGAESVGLVFAARVPSGDLAGLPELVVGGLREDDARALLGSVLTGPLDERVRDQIVAETRGNPLALLELPRGLTAAELAGGFGLPGALSLPRRHRGEFPAARRGSAGRDPAAAAARRGRADRGPGAGVAGGRAARDRRRGGGARGRGRPGRVRRPGAVPPSAGALGGLPVGDAGGTAAGCTAPWPRPPIRRSIPTAAPGTGPRPPPGRTRTSPRNLSARPAGRRRAAGWPPRRRSLSGPRR